MGRVGESLIEIGRELYREGAANSNFLPPLRYGGSREVLSQRISEIWLECMELGGHTCMVVLAQ